MRGQRTPPKKGSFSRSNSACLTFSLLSLAFFASLSFPQPPDPSQIPEPQIAYALHAVWDPDLTDNNPSVCTTSDTVAVPSFHFYAGWKDSAPAFFSVDWVLIEELTTDHEPQVWLFGNLQGESGFPYCPMPPVSDPENWNWTTFSFAPMVGFAMHNAPYRITVQWRYGVYMKGPRGPFQTSITIHVQNLVVTSPDVGKVLRWDPEKGITDTSFSYKIECAQKKQVSVRVRIYDLSGNVVYEVTEQKLCPGGYSFSWDGTVNTGDYGYPPEEGSNPAPAGLYTFDVEVEANPYDKDAVRSKALGVVSGPVDYLGYDNGGTPEDESDDNHLYYLRWYALYSGRDASWGEIWLYDPDLVKVQGWGVPMLVCVVHGWNDGLGASLNGEVHGVIISVPVSLMEKAGTYRFVLHFYDDYADSYRNHQVKAASEVNALAEPLRFEVSTDPSGDSQEGHPGHQIGKKEKTKFYVVIKATLNWRGEPGKTIAFMLKRTKTGEVKRKTGYLVTDPNDPDGPKDIGSGLKRWTFRTHKVVNDEGVTDWVITREKGRWEIKVAPPHESNTVKFKINKRKQIVITANSWVGYILPENETMLCHEFTAKVYNHVDIRLTGTVQPQYDATVPDEGEGCLIFYTVRNFPDAAHVGIQDGEYIIDINCWEGHSRDVRRHSQGYLARLYKATQQEQGYTPQDPQKKAPQELKNLDGE